MRPTGHRAFAYERPSFGRRRRRWSEAQKRQIVAETHEPGASLPMVAQRRNPKAGEIFGVVVADSTAALALPSG